VKPPIAKRQASSWERKQGPPMPNPMRAYLEEREHTLEKRIA